MALPMTDSSPSSHSSPPKRPRIAVVLAAGRGTRMRSERPKPLHPVAGRPMLHWVLDAARAAGCERLLVVVGYGAEEVKASTPDAADVTWVEQRRQLGTGHALAQAEAALAELGVDDALLLVLSGDVPMVRPETLDALADAAEEGGALAVATLDDPGSLGRVLARDDDPRALDRIVEASDATDDELAIRRVNAGLYALPAPAVFDDLRRVGRGNAQGEIYLTDALGAAAADGREVRLHELEDFAEALGVNDRRDQARVHGILIRRHLESLMDAGVTVLDPSRTVVEPTVEVGRDTVLHPGVSLHGRTVVGEGAVLHQGVWAEDAEIEAGVEVRPYSTLEGARVESGCRVGPFARLRPGAVMRRGASVGNFVELKETVMGAGAKAGHLAYLGDAEVGEGANIGAGTITCNYDGRLKHRTKIGKGAFVGSDTMLVAPVEVGDEATTGAGSTITRDVPDGALGLGRARQRVIEGWAEKMAQKTKRESAEDESKDPETMDPETRDPETMDLETTAGGGRPDARSKE